MAINYEVSYIDSIKALERKLGRSLSSEECDAIRKLVLTNLRNSRTDSASKSTSTSKQVLTSQLSKRAKYSSAKAFKSQGMVPGKHGIRVMRS